MKGVFLGLLVGLILGIAIGHDATIRYKPTPIYHVDSLVYDCPGYDDLIQTCDSEICENIRLRKLLGDTLTNNYQTHMK